MFGFSFWSAEMGGIGFEVGLEPIRDDAKAETLVNRLEEIVEIFGGFLSYYGGDNGEVFDYFYDAAYDEGFLSPDTRSVTFVFKDYAGCCNRSCELLYYWGQLAFACEREAFEAIFIEEGFTIAGGKTLAEIVRVASDETPYFVNLRGQLYAYSPKYDSIYADSESLELDELTEEEASLLAEIKEDRTSRDSATSMIAPSEGFHDALLNLAKDGDPDAIGSAIWYGSNVAHVSDVLLAAVLEAGANRPVEQIRWDARKVERMASRANDSAFDVIRSALVGDNLAVKALATAAIVGFERDDVDTTLLQKTAIQNGLQSDSPYCDVAVSMLSTLAPTRPERLELTDALADRLDAGCGTPSTEHDFVLAIVNLWIHEGSAPERALETLQQFAGKEGHEAQGIAQWGIAVL